jgi:hypothetical protein
MLQSQQTLLPSPAPPPTDPAAYPPSVLWFLNNCKNDPTLKMSAGNGSRPSMASVIRRQDGTRITSGEYQVIKASAQRITARLLQLPVPSQHTATHRTITYFTLYHSQELGNALVELENLHPLLALCAAHWKASHMIANCLTAVAARETNDVNDISDSRASSRPPVKTVRKRPISGTEQMPAAKKARTGTTGTSNLNHVETHTESEPLASPVTVTTTSSPNPGIPPQNGRPTMKRGLAPTIFTTNANSSPADASGQDPTNSSSSSGSPASGPGLHELSGTLIFLISVLPASS